MGKYKIPFAEEETEVRRSSDSTKFTKLRRLAAGQARGQKCECRWSPGARRVGSSVRSRAQGPRRGGGQPTGEVSVSRSISVRGERATAVRGPSRGRQGRTAPEGAGGLPVSRVGRGGSRPPPRSPSRSQSRARASRARGRSRLGRTARPGARGCDSRPAPRVPPARPASPLAARGAPR